jgi:hypothetical protein
VGRCARENCAAGPPRHQREEARATAAHPGDGGEDAEEGEQHTGVAGGSVFTTAGWAPGATGFDIDATAGVSQITVTARTG